MSILPDAGDSTDACFRNWVPGTGLFELPYNEVSSILRADDGTMWLSMFGGGLCKAGFPDGRFTIDRLDKIRDKYQTSSVRSIFHAGGSMYWLGLIGYGMVLYDAEDGTGVNYLDCPDFRWMPYTSTVDVIIRRKSTGEICFGTYSRGVWLYDEAEHKVRTISGDGLEWQGVSALMEDSSGNLWIGTRDDVHILDMSGELYGFDEYFPSSAGVLDGGGLVVDIKEGGNGDVWIALSYAGIVRVSAGTGECRRYSVGERHDSNNISCLHVDSGGTVWAGSMYSGLAWYSPGRDMFETITSFSAIDNKGIGNIAEDNTGRIWLTASNTVISFVPGDVPGNFGQLNIYAVADSREAFSFNTNSSVILDDGRLLFGCSRGILEFAADSMSAMPAPSQQPMAFTDFMVNGVSLRSMPRSERERISSEDIGYTDRIVLSHKENSFTVDFSLMNYTRPEENIYTYMLEGHDEDFVAVDARSHSATYSGLSPGKYVFHLKGKDRDGGWSKEEKILNIWIKPSPWLSWWAICIYVILLCLLLYALVRFLVYRFRMLQAIGLEKMEKAKIKELNQMKLNFFTNVTHELMTPLSIIMASVENLWASGAEGMQKILPVLGANTTRLMRLIQQLLEFRKMESGNLKLSVGYDNLSAFVRGCTDAFVPLVQHHSQKISFVSTPEDIWGWFDSDKVDKIVYNLLSNATKYTPDDGCISVVLSLDREGLAEIEVANTGSLMSEETISGLFERFYDGDYRRYNTTGTGIGLSLVKDLVTLHHGTVTVTSTPENGNIFRVCLPVAKNEFSCEEVDETLLPGQSSPAFSMPPPQADEGRPAMQKGPKDYTVMIVDDNEELGMLVDNMLSVYFNIERALSGEAALQFLSGGGKIDLVVSDVMMPGMDGIELCRTIKSRLEYSHIPVILLTAKRAEKDQIDGWNSGADGYVSKPCSFPVLYAQIMNCLKRRERQVADFRRQVVFDVPSLDYTPVDEAFLQKAIDCVNSHFSESSFDLPEFSEAMNVSKSVLTEKLKSLTGLTPAAFVLNVRLTVASRLLVEKPDVRISDIAYSVGFNDAKYFSTCFKKKFGMTPKEFILEDHSGQ